MCWQFTRTSRAQRARRPGFGSTLQGRPPKKLQAASLTLALCYPRLHSRKAYVFQILPLLSTAALLAGFAFLIPAPASELSVKPAGQPVSEGLTNQEVEITALHLVGKVRQADLSKIQIEGVIRQGHQRQVPAEAAGIRAKIAGQGSASSQGNRQFIRASIRPYEGNAGNA